MRVARLARRVRVRHVVGAATILGVLLASCSSDDAADSSPSSTESSSSAATSTSGTTGTTAPATCALGGGLAPGSATRTLTVAGVEREFLVRIPSAPAATMALVVSFHGAGSNMVEQAVYGGFDALGEAEGFVVATPNGVDGAVRQWRYLGTPDDVAFARAIVADLVTDACVDPERVYAAGMSSGSAMSASLACEASDTFRGFGLVAADFYVPAVCAASTPRPMVIFHSTDDVVVPYAGGTVNAGGAGNGLPVAPAEETAAAWAEHHRCSAGPTETVLSPEVVRLDWSGCEAPIAFHRIVGGGHTWPGSIDVARLGPVTDEIDATRVMWDWFEGR